MPAASCKWFAGTKTSPPEYAHTPPSFGAFSRTSAFFPASCATIAAASPPSPEPTATTSTVMSHLPSPSMESPSGDHSAVDHDRGAVDVHGVVGGEERDRPGHLVRLAEAAEGHEPREHGLVHPVRELERLDHRRLDAAGADAVDPDPLAPVLGGERLRQEDDAPLRRAV